MKWIALLFVAGAAWADVVVVQRVEQGAQCTQVTLKLKGTKIRADIGPEITLIMDTATGSAVTLRHSQKTALLVTAAAARQLMQKEPPSISPTPKPTGRTAVIDGRETREFSSGKAAWWVAARLAGGDPLGEMIDALEKTPMVKLADGLPGLGGEESLPGVPLRTEITTPGGRKITTSVVSAQEKPLEAIDFEIPPGYRLLPAPVF